MKYIAGSILYMAAAIFAHNPASHWADTSTLVCFLGFGLICLGILEDVITFMRKNQIKPNDIIFFVKNIFMKNPTKKE